MRIYSILFSTDRRMILLWIVSPILFLLIFYFSFFFYFKVNIKNLEERKELIKSMFAMNQKAEEAKEILSRYKNASVMADTIETLNSEFNKIAVNADFNISSLTVGNSTVKKSSFTKAAATPTAVFTVSVKGWGTVNSVTRFFNAAYASFQFLTVETANINIADFSSKNSYNADFVFSCHYLK